MQVQEFNSWWGFGGKAPDLVLESPPHHGFTNTMMTMITISTVGISLAIR